MVAVFALFAVIEIAVALDLIYFYFDPDEEKRSLGTFSVMMEVAWLRSQGGRFHYLGLYVQDCRHLVYKANYFPHERLIDGNWQPFAGR